jgi:sugar lactone lactonase YvrE
MKNPARILISLLIVVTSQVGVKAQLNSIQSNELTKIWETPPTLTTSESVCYDAERNILYISCINGNPVDKDNSGFIAMVDLKGNIIMNKWVTGLNAPKGMGIYKNSLYVTDIDCVVRIDIQSGEIIEKFMVDGARFLNDIAISTDGSIYISDMVTNIIHVIHNDEQPELFLNDKHINNPNGLLTEGKYLLIGTQDGIYRARFDNGKALRIISVDGGIDGLKSNGEGSYFISDWKGKIQLVSTDEKPVLLLNTSEQGINAADLEYIPSQKLLLIPTFSNNRVVAYKFGL